MLRLVVGAGLHYEYLRTASTSSIWVWLLAPIMPNAIMPCFFASFVRKVVLVPILTGTSATQLTMKTSRSELGALRVQHDMTHVVCSVGYPYITVPFERYHHLH